jgi:hypothetical protein
MYYESAIDLRNLAEGEMRTLLRWWLEISNLQRYNDNGSEN